MSSWQMTRHRSRNRLTALGLALAGALLAVTPVAAASPVVHTRDSAQKETYSVYFPDDICGPRAGWTTFVLTRLLHVTDLGDSLHVTAIDTGRYSTDFDDPAIEDYESQFTEALHVNMTRGGTVTFNYEFHDFPGDITIRGQTVFVEIDGQVMVDRESFRVDGCP
jgi:hypothetical protein